MYLMTPAVNYTRCSSHLFELIKQEVFRCTATCSNSNSFSWNQIFLVACNCQCWPQFFRVAVNVVVSLVLGECDITQLYHAGCSQWYIFGLRDLSTPIPQPKMHCWLQPTVKLSLILFFSCFCGTVSLTAVYQHLRLIDYLNNRLIKQFLDPDFLSPIHV